MKAGNPYHCFNPNHLPWLHELSDWSCTPISIPSFGILRALTDRVLSQSDFFFCVTFVHPPLSCRDFLRNKAKAALIAAEFLSRQEFSTGKERGTAMSFELIELKSFYLHGRRLVFLLFLLIGDTGGKLLSRRLKNLSFTF